MQRPNPLADPVLRRSLAGTAVAGLVVTGLFAVVAVIGPAATTAWIAAGTVALAYGSALFMTLIGYRLGWYARARDEIERTSGALAGLPGGR